ncbi:MAG: hypothetical protein CVT79_09095, partial [Alphaproteobacteria bacterium HGW-Alphaproteobacteria-18]
PVKAGWDDPVWQSAIPPNMVGVFLEESQTPPPADPSAPNAGILPCEAGEVDAKRTEGEPQAPTPPSREQPHPIVMGRDRVERSQ